MCWAKKCCFVVPLHSACYLIGIANFFFAALTTLSGVVLLILDYIHEKNYGHERHYLQSIVELDMTKTCLNILIIGAIIIGSLWMIITSFLFVGIKKNIPSLVLTFFVGGIFLTIIGLLTALLELVALHWAFAVIKGILCLINIHFLVVIHTVYELMLQGKVFMFANRNSHDQDPFLDAEDILNG